MMQTKTKSRLMGYWTAHAELRNVTCIGCGDVTAFPASLGWKLVSSDDTWACDCCKCRTCEESAVVEPMKFPKLSKPRGWLGVVLAVCVVAWRYR
jgi:hypothetical protein